MGHLNVRLVSVWKYKNVKESDVVLGVIMALLRLFGYVASTDSSTLRTFDLCYKIDGNKICHFSEFYKSNF